MRAQTNNMVASGKVDSDVESDACMDFCDRSLILSVIIIIIATKVHRMVVMNRRIDRDPQGDVRM